MIGKWERMGEEKEVNLDSSSIMDREKEWKKMQDIETSCYKRWKESFLSLFLHILSPFFPSRSASPFPRNIKSSIYHQMKRERERKKNRNLRFISIPTLLLLFLIQTIERGRESVCERREKESFQKILDIDPMAIYLCLSLLFSLSSFLSFLSPSFS